MKKHEKAFGEIKNYYNDITHNNLDLIRSLKEEVCSLIAILGDTPRRSYLSHSHHKTGGQEVRVAVCWR